MESPYEIAFATQTNLVFANRNLPGLKVVLHITVFWLPKEAQRMH